MCSIIKTIVILIATTQLLGCNSDSAATNFRQTTSNNFHWAYIIDQGSGARVERSSDEAISIETLQPGEYIVTFPVNARNLGCTATLNNNVGFVTAVPGDKSGLAANKVRVLTLNTDNSFGSRDFTVVVYRRD